MAYTALEIKNIRRLFIMGKKKLGVVSIILIVLIAGFLFSFLRNKEFTQRSSGSSSSAAVTSSSTATKLYTHHFDVNLTHDDLEAIPELYRVDLNFNVISSSQTPYTKLSDLDGDGYIISAFGLLHDGDTPITTQVFEAKLFYKSLQNGALLLHIHNLQNNEVSCVIVTGLNNFELHDSVTKN